ncbi:unnamed protein product [Trichogramma brassicae]|uniref:C2H2-type domain-containing protein n=1 Tax=Trichogramma brassicae TaxID=86971 RepID=A0A6H5IHK9_9HYME|nr:unnamed protein product [Trichogramma brassicae]
MSRLRSGLGNPNQTLSSKLLKLNRKFELNLNSFWNGGNKQQQQQQPHECGKRKGAESEARVLKSKRRVLPLLHTSHTTWVWIKARRAGAAYPVALWARPVCRRLCRASPVITRRRRPRPAAAADKPVVAVVVVLLLLLLLAPLIRQIIRPPVVETREAAVAVPEAQRQSRLQRRRRRSRPPRPSTLSTTRPAAASSSGGRRGYPTTPAELGQLNASTREPSVPITSPSGNNTGAPSLLSIATTASTPPANEPSTATTTTTTASSHSSPVGHHQHFQGLHLLGATNSLFGSIFAPLLPQSSWLYNPLYHSQQYLLEPEWHALALRMAQQRLQRPDGHSSRLEDLRKFRAASSAAAATDNDESNRADDGGDETADRDRDRDKDRDSPESSIEVDDSDEPRPKLARSSQSDESLDSPKMSPSRTDSEIALEDSSSRLRPSFENMNEPDHGTQLDQSDESSHLHHCGGLTVKIRVEGTVDLSTKTRSHHRDKENVGQDLTTSRRKEDDIVDVVMDRETMRPRKEKSPKPRQVWRPCTKRFGYKQSLLVHIKTVHEEFSALYGTIEPKAISSHASMQVSLGSSLTLKNNRIHDERVKTRLLGPRGSCFGAQYPARRQISPVTNPMTITARIQKDRVQN